MMRNLFFLLFFLSVVGYADTFTVPDYFCDDNATVTFSCSAFISCNGGSHVQSASIVFVKSSGETETGIINGTVSGDTRYFTFNISSYVSISCTSFCRNCGGSHGGSISYSYTPCEKKECAIHGNYCGLHDNSGLDHTKCNVCVAEGGYGLNDSSGSCDAETCPVHNKLFCKTHKLPEVHYYGTKKHSNGVTHIQCFQNENDLNSFLVETMCEYCEEFKCDLCRPDYHKGCNVCYNVADYAKGTKDCVKATCSEHNAVYCSARSHENKRSHWEGTLDHGNGVSHKKCFSTDADRLKFETPDYCEYCEEFKCDICRPDYHVLCGLCVGVKKDQGWGKGKAGCVESVCPVHKERYCSGHNYPEHWVGTLTHAGVNGGTITHTDCLENEAKRDDFQTGNICDYCGEIDCKICNAFDHSKCNRCINEGGAGLLDCTKATCSIHNKEYCATHNPTHWVETLNCGFAKHTRCFKTQDEVLEFLKVENCEYCGKIKCPICGGHDKCQDCINGNPCTPTICPHCKETYCIKHHAHKTLSWTCDGPDCTPGVPGKGGKSHTLCLKKQSDIDNESSIWATIRAKCSKCGLINCHVCGHNEQATPDKECPELEDCQPVKCTVCDKIGCMVHDPHFALEITCEGSGGKDSKPAVHESCFKTELLRDQERKKYSNLPRCAVCGVLKCPTCGHKCACPNTKLCDVRPCNQTKADGTICRNSYCIVHNDKCPECGYINHDVPASFCPNTSSCVLVKCEVKKLDGTVCGEQYCKVHQKHSHRININNDGEEEEIVSTVTLKEVEENDFSLDTEKYPALAELKRKLLPDFSFLTSGSSTDIQFSSSDVGFGDFRVDLVVNPSDSYFSPLFDRFSGYCRLASQFFMALCFVILVITALRQW